MIEKVLFEKYADKQFMGAVKYISHKLPRVIFHPRKLGNVKGGSNKTCYQMDFSIKENQDDGISPHLIESHLIGVEKMLSYKFGSHNLVIKNLSKHDTISRVYEVNLSGGFEDLKLNKVLDPLGVIGGLRFEAHKLSQSLKKLTREYGGADLYARVILLIKKPQYQFFSDKVLDAIIDFSIPGFKRLAKKYKGKV